MRLQIVLLKPIRDDFLYGTEQSALDVAAALSRQGVDVDIVQWNPSPLPVKSKEVRLFRANFKGQPGLLKLTSSLIHLIRQTRPDALYAYADCFEDTLVPSFLATLLTRTKFILCVPDDALKEIDVQSLPEIFVTWRGERHSLRSAMRHTLYHALRRIAIRTTAVSLVSASFVREYATKQLKARRVHLIPLGLDETWFGRTTNELRFDAIYIGGLWGYKNVDVLIKAWKEVTTALPDAKLLILGEGGARPGLDRLVATLGLSDSVLFKSYVATTYDVHQLLSQSKVFAFASVWEGWGRAVTEAMATGLPCVLSDIPVFRELYSQTAVLVPPGDTHLFAEGIVGLLQDRSRYDELSDRGVKLVSGFTWDAVASRMLQVIQDG